MRAFWVDSTPNKGCTITLLNLDVALRNGIHIDRTKTVKLYHAAGASMHDKGMANIRVCANNIQAILQVAVSSELKETMLISCDDLRKLSVIPADFSNAVLTVKTNSQLLRKFDKTLSDELDPFPMKCAPMSITLQDDAIPICVTTARRVPKHYEQESKKTITELIKRKVIAPVNEPTAWCSPAFFVPKADGKRVLLVTDSSANWMPYMGTSNCKPTMFLSLIHI